uniref:hypothetical protein n=1 Tax=Vibrio cholerae TaxID=666 RepID=UPI003F582E96
MSEPALPQTLSLTDSCLENEETSSNQQSEVKKEQAEKKKKVHKKSNKYSNHTKAKGHLAAIAGATTLGAVLAPFTGGLSLLPTAFVVLFGNATALAMYGGSEFVLGQQGANNQLEDKKEPEENKQPEDLVPLPPRPMPLMSSTVLMKLMGVVFRMITNLGKKELMVKAIRLIILRYSILI